MQEQTKQNHTSQKGITLIALIVTIILMLILAAVTTRITSDGKVFQYAGNAKNNVEIANEKEIIMQASILSETIGKNRNRSSNKTTRNAR